MPVLLSAPPPHTHIYTPQRRRRERPFSSGRRRPVLCTRPGALSSCPPPPHPRHLCSRWEALKAARRDTRARREGSSAMATAPLGCHRACAGREGRERARERERCPGASAPPLYPGLGKGSWESAGERSRCKMWPCSRRGCSVPGELQRAFRPPAGPLQPWAETLCQRGRTAGQARAGRR